MPAGDTGQRPSEALAEQFRQVRGRLLAWIRRRVPDPSEAEDLLQESFLRLTQLGSRAEISQPERYLFRTAQSVLADRRRRRRVREADAHVSLEDDQHRDEDADALRALLAKEKLRKVVEALRALPERTRSIFVLRRIEGLRYAEIARRLNVSLSTVEKDMARAIEHLLTAEEAS